MLSPGDLSQAHHELEGVTQCTRCHTAGEQLSSSKCLECHTELNAEIKAGTGFHGKIPPVERACEKCHHEHQGLTFPLIDWGPQQRKGFNHALTGWPLQGKHARVDCETCHQPKRIKADSVLRLIKAHPEVKTMLGLSDKCSSCHFDEHRGQLAGPCSQCHTEKAWMPATGFNHDHTDYPLAGAHRRVACTGCHPSVNDTTTAKDVFPAPVHPTFTRYSPVAHESCQDCHADPHKGSFGDRCDSCHRVDDWKSMKAGQQNATFHDKTRFPLQGAHADVPCKSCHGPFPLLRAKAMFRGIPFEHCTDCHPDAHLGQLAAPACERCHTVAGFLPPRFTLADHDKTAYPLQGAHRAVACNACHPATPSMEARVPLAMKTFLHKRQRPLTVSLALLKPSAKTEHCQSCHADPHAGQFNGAPQKACEACHQPAAWSVLLFNHDRDSRFPLTGKHAQAPCASCHSPKQKRYRGLATACASCHADVHAGQFAGADRMTRCDHCHATDSFARTTFAHQPPFTDFLIEGKHLRVTCQQCHPMVTVAPGVQVQRFKPLPTACEGCHDDFHHGAFKGFSQ